MSERLIDSYLKGVEARRTVVRNSEIEQKIIRAIVKKQNPNSTSRKTESLNSKEVSHVEIQRT